jgi:hypothetical protein
VLPGCLTGNCVDIPVHFSRDVARYTEVTNATFANKMMMVFLGICLKILKPCDFE